MCVEFFDGEGVRIFVTLYTSHLTTHTTHLAPRTFHLTPRISHRTRQILIFSGSTKLLDIVEEMLIRIGTEYSRLDGNTQIKFRANVCKEFNTGQVRLDRTLLLLLSALGVSLDHVTCRSNA